MKTALGATPNMSWWCQASGTSSPSGTASCMFMVATGTAPFWIQRPSQGTSLTSRGGWRWKKRPITFPLLASSAPWMSWAWVAPKRSYSLYFNTRNNQTNSYYITSHSKDFRPVSLPPKASWVWRQTELHAWNVNAKTCIRQLKKVNYSLSSERHETLCLIQEGPIEIAWLAVQPAVTLAVHCAYGFKMLQSLNHWGSYSSASICDLIYDCLRRLDKFCTFTKSSWLYSYSFAEKSLNSSEGAALNSCLLFKV